MTHLPTKRSETSYGPGLVKTGSGQEVPLRMAKPLGGEAFKAI